MRRSVEHIGIIPTGMASCEFPPNRASSRGDRNSASPSETKKTALQEEIVA